MHLQVVGLRLECTLVIIVIGCRDCHAWLVYHWFRCSVFRQTGMSTVICSYVFCLCMKLDDHVSEHQRSAELRVGPGDMCPFSCGQQVG